MKHCWAGYKEFLRDTDEQGYLALEAREWAEGIHLDQTCMLEDGHAGAHDWTPDGEISITFAGAQEL